MSETTTVAEEPRDAIAADSDGGREISEPVTNSAAPDEGDDLPDYDFSDDGDLGDEEDDRDEPDPDEIRAHGASRTHENGNIYWLNVDQLREFNRMDRTLTDDDDFWAWFDAAVNKWGKKPIGKASKKRGHFGGLASWSSGSGGGFSGWSGAKKYLSDWWGGSSYFGGSSDKVRKLAVAVQAISTTIRVVDSHDRRMRVMLATDEKEGAPESYTAYDEQVIQVSPMALLDAKIEEGEGIDITTGFALHEASHAEYSERTLKHMRQPTLLRPVSIVSLLHNVLEDVRIEHLTGEEFPGFVGYFEKALDYLWKISKDHRPVVWGPELKDKMNAVIAACKWYAEFKPKAAGNPALAAEVEWWHEWVEGYRTNTVPMRAALIAGLDRLKADPDTKKQLEEMEEKEKAAEKAEGLKPELKPEDLKKLVKKMLEEAGMGGLASCSSGESPGGGVADPSGKRKPGIGAGEAGEVARLVKSEIEAGFVKEMKIPDMGGLNPRITVLRPPETAASKRLFEPANPGLVSRMRRAFFFRPSAIEDVERLMKTGQIDEDELWRGGLPDGDYRMFEQRRIESAPDTAITFLIDASGSMAGHSGGYGSHAKTKVQIAQDLAQIMLACLKDMNGVRVRVRAHTGDTPDSGSKGVALYRIWDVGEPQTRLSLMGQPPNGAIQMGNNYDGYAIGWCIKELVQHAKPNEQMVLIVLSDGYPAGSSYGGGPAYAHMRETIAWGEKQGVDTIQIAIEGGMNQAEMFKHFVMFESTEKLPMQLTALLRKIFPTR
jgi:hypothetical protein